MFWTALITSDEAMDVKKKKRWAYVVLAVLIASGSFLFGLGAAGCLYSKNQRRQERVLMNSYELDERNQTLASGMACVQIEEALIFADGEAEAWAGIGNSSDNPYGCTAVLMRDSTGEILYRSDMIEPGYYIENIKMETALQKGYYPCTVIWSFYRLADETKEEELIGHTAQKTVVVVEK